MRLLEVTGYTCAGIGAAWALSFALGATWCQWGPLCPAGYWLFLFGVQFAPAGAVLLAIALALCTAAAHQKERVTCHESH